MLGHLKVDYIWYKFGLYRNFSLTKFLGGFDSCSGDSGGPLVCIQDGEALLKGITSWGNGCAKKDHPGVYARLQFANDWIDSVIANDGQKSTHITFDNNGEYIFTIDSDGYTSNAICNHYTDALDSGNIKVEVQNMDIENHIDCDRDYISISQVKHADEYKQFQFYQVPSTNLLRKMCGTCNINAFVVDGRYPLIFGFRSNENYNFSGVKIRLSLTKSEPTVLSDTTISDINCKGKCDQTRFANCAGKCSNKIYSAPSGSLTSHIGYNAGVYYGTHLSCQWIIDLRNQPSVNTERPITLIFSNIELEVSEPDCTLDYVQIFGWDESLVFLKI